MYTTLTWLLRWGHIVGGALWLGGYALTLLGILPLLQRTRDAALGALAVSVVRVMTYAGMATIAFGLILITRTRGFVSLFAGEWGAIIIACIVIAVALLGVGDGGLRPGIRQLVDTGDASKARRFAWIGLVLTVLAVGLMTRAIYAGS